MKKSTQAEIFEALLTPHINDLYKTAFRLSGTREAAEDLVQDVLVKLYPKTAASRSSLTVGILSVTMPP